MLIIRSHAVDGCVFSVAKDWSDIRSSWALIGLYWHFSGGRVVSELSEVDSEWKEQPLALGTGQVVVAARWTSHCSLQRSARRTESV
jgi:hypothetical protein